MAESTTFAWWVHTTADAALHDGERDEAGARSRPIPIWSMLARGGRVAPRKKARRPTRPRGVRAVGRSIEITREGDTVTLGVHLADLELPPQEYEADVMWPMVRLGAVSLLLDRLSLHEESRVQTRVEVRMPYETFMTVWASTQAEPFADQFRAWLAKHPTEVAQSPPPTREDPEQGRVVVRAQLARLSYVGSDAEIDFYSIPAPRMSEAIRNVEVNSVPVAGVLRVTTTTAALATLLRACEPLVTQITSIIDREGGG